MGLAQLGQMEMRAAAKNANLERLEDHMTSEALQQTAGNHAGSYACNSSKQGSATGMCVVCMEHEKSVVLIPCKHMCMCKGCTDKLIAQSERQKAICPLCRDLIMDTMEIFT